MTAISIHLSNDLAKASQQAAHKLGLSRTQFIRRAIAHELENLERQQEQKAMVKGFAAMQKDPLYLKEAKKIEQNLNASLPEDEEGWWEKN